MGQTNPKFNGNLFTPDNGQPSLPNKPEDARLNYYGFRLMREA
jgi:hypothetical protein